MRSRILLFMALLTAVSARAQTSLPFTLSGALSLYYSWSVQQPPDGQRAYSTQPATNGQIAVDLAVITGQWSSDHVDARLALQAGTWADVNYVDGDEGWKVVHEANVRLRVDSVFSVIAGIVPSNIGHESSINATNFTLSRSLNADFTPYFMTGAGVIFRPSGHLRFAVYAVNGWQRITDNNDQLSGGTTVEWQPTSATTVSWNTYLGNDEPTSQARFRMHNNAWIDHRFSPTVRAVLMGDLSLLRNRLTDTYDAAWYVGVKGAWQAARIVRFAARTEMMNDPHNVLIRTGPAFETIGLSLGMDLFPADPLMVRFEVRSLHATQEVFPSSSGMARNDLFGTVALAAQF